MPKPIRLVTDLVNDPTTAIARGTTYENRSHLAPSFFERIVTKYEGTCLGQHELLAEILEVSDRAWFKSFDAAKQVSEAAEYDPRMSQKEWIHPSAFRLQPSETVTVFGDYHAEGRDSEAAARAILARGEALPWRGRLDSVRLDPASSARTGIGPTAYAEFERVFGPRALGRWPSHRLLDGLDQLEVLLDRSCLLIHPRCEKLPCAFRNYSRRKNTVGVWLDEPADPQHPHEDLMDALRGGIHDRFPEGRIEQPNLKRLYT